MRSLTIFFFLSAIFNSLIWMILVPVWHTPDEQAHFAQVAFLAEKGRNPDFNENNLTEEIYISEQLLGTVRDKAGNNRFTFHPEYHIEYTNAYIGKYEASISALTNTQSKSRFIKEEASRYQPLYYIPAAWIYKLFYQSDLFTRVYLVRLWSLFLFIGTVFISYTLGKLIFSKNSLLPLILATLVGFQPMMVFANIGVTSDALGNLVFNIFLYFIVLVIIKGIDFKNILLLVLASLIAINVKTQFIIIVPTLIILFFYIALRDYSKKPKVLIAAISSVVILLLFLFKIRFFPLVFAIDSLGKFNSQSFAKFTLEYTLPHTVNEVMPWYWGIYDWLGVTYPRIIHRIINRIVFITAFGFSIWCLNIIRKKLWDSRRVQSIFFLVFILVIYFLALSYYDWLSWYNSGFQLGVQGRYFFPLITVNMLILLLGWSALFPDKWNIKLYAINLFGFLMISLNFYGLYTISSTYYDLSSLKTFMLQASQYKPWFLKGNLIAILFLSYLISVFFYIAYLFSLKPKKSKISTLN